MELFRYALHGVGVETGVEVHGDLNPEDERENGPLLPCGKGEPEFIGAIGLGDLDFFVCVRVEG